ncbi:hypothetical protein ACFV0O_19280 [Kitasatospora sp. NPDC059577]
MNSSAQYDRPKGGVVNSPAQYDRPKGGVVTTERGSAARTAAL